MAQRIRRFSPGQTTKVMGVTYALTGLVYLPFYVIMAIINPDGNWLELAIMFWIFMSVFGTVLVAISCVLYNVVAGWVGGIEIELEVPSATQE